MIYALRDAVPGDISDIMQIEYYSFPEGIREDMAVFEKRISAFPQGFIILTDESGSPKGYFASEIWQLPLFNQASALDTSLFTLNHDISEHHTDTGNTLYISSFALLPDCRGSGMGETFFTEAVGRIRSAFPELSQSVLIVNEAWVRARAIYRKHGYKECGTIPLFFKPEGDAPQSAIIMTGALS